jgi:hypothetical protein
LQNRPPGSVLPVFAILVAAHVPRARLGSQDYLGALIPSAGIGAGQLEVDGSGRQRSKLN